MARKTTPIKHELIENGDDEYHATLIEEHLESATHFIAIIAFAKISGFKLIRQTLIARAEKGLRATFVIGIDFYQTDPELLRALLRLRTPAKKAGGEIKVYMGRTTNAPTLHPKAYWFKSRKQETLIMGSANMTSGGLKGNHEISIMLAGSNANWKAWLDRWIAERIENRDIVEATSKLIGNYERQCDIFRAAMKAAEQRATRSMAAPKGQVITLADLLEEMRADNGPNGFTKVAKRRWERYGEAKQLLTELTHEPNLNRQEFLTRYENLCRCWHSGGLQRGKNIVAGKAARFQKALRALDADQSKDAKHLFNLLKGHFDKIPNAGINVLTEILHTRDPARYPVMNRNSVAGLGLANITDYPRSLTKKTVDGDCYARFTVDAETLRDRLGLASLSELDGLFNFAYWKPADLDEEN